MIPTSRLGLAVEPRVDDRGIQAFGHAAGASEQLHHPHARLLLQSKKLCMNVIGDRYAGHVEAWHPCGRHIKTMRADVPYILWVSHRWTWPPPKPPDAPVTTS